MTQYHHVKPRNDIKRIFRACGHALVGLKTAFQDNIAFKQEVCLSVLIIPMALFFGVDVIEQTILIGSWFLVLIVEIINSTLEDVVDRISLEIHPLSKKIKDMGAAAVLLAIINAGVVWVVILISHL